MCIRDRRTLPLSPEMVAQKASFSFFGIKVNFNRIKSATKFVSVKTSSGKIVARSFPYLMVHKYWNDK